MEESDAQEPHPPGCLRARSSPSWEPGLREKAAADPHRWLRVTGGFVIVRGRRLYSATDQAGYEGAFYEDELQPLRPGHPMLEFWILMGPEGRGGTLNIRGEAAAPR